MSFLLKRVSLLSRALPLAFIAHLFHLVWHSLDVRNKKTKWNRPLSGALLSCRESKAAKHWSSWLNISPNENGFNHLLWNRSQRLLLSGPLLPLREWQAGRSRVRGICTKWEPWIKGSSILMFFGARKGRRINRARFSSTRSEERQCLAAHFLPLHPVSRSERSNLKKTLANNSPRWTDLGTNSPGLRIQIF